MSVELEVICEKSRQGSDAQPLLFVHGAWADAWCWRYYLSYFSEQGYDCYALSLRGHGKSTRDKPLKFIRIDDYVEDLRRVVDTVHQETGKKPILFGQSMGGLIVQRYLAADAEIPQAILIAATPPHGIWKATLRVVRSQPFSFLWVNLIWSLWPVIRTKERVRDSFFSADVDPIMLDECFTHMQDESYLAYLDMLIFKFSSPKKVQTPVLVLGGRKDLVFSPDEVEATAKAYGTQAHIFEDIAHQMLLENNWRQVADYILEHLLIRS